MSNTGIDEVSDSPVPQNWPSYRTIWRWHFYAGLFSIPLILCLSVTGSICLFRPQIESLLDRPYEHLALDGPRAGAADQVRAALATVPGSSLHAYQLPRSSYSAAQIIVGKGKRISASMCIHGRCKF